VEEGDEKENAVTSAAKSGQAGVAACGPVFIGAFTVFGRHGFANGLQRYRCCACGKTFNGLTGTPLARLRLKDKWLAYLDCMRDPACTVKRAADNVNVHGNTSLRWRHRFLH
jgi:transposase-like protein